MRFSTLSRAVSILSAFLASSAGATSASIQFFEGTPVALSGSGRQLLLSGVRTDPPTTSLGFGNGVAGLWDLDDRSYELLDASELGFGVIWADLSTDGTTAVGGSGAFTVRGEAAGPVRWRKESGFERLERAEETSGFRRSHAVAGTSGNGDLVIGSIGHGLPRWPSLPERALWNEDGDLVDLPMEPTGTTTAFEHISDDGLTLAGIRQEILEDRLRMTAIRWTEEAGSIELLPTSLEASTSMTTALSGDGAVAFGTYRRNSPEFARAFVVDAKSGFLDLGSLVPDAFSGTLVAASRDGRVAVGEASYFGRAEGSFRFPREAIVWSRHQGARSLANVLEGLGVDLRGATLSSAVDVSSDGTHVLGRTSDGFAFIAIIPEPSTALLMGLGLLGLAAGSRRSRNRTPSSKPER